MTEQPGTVGMYIDAGGDTPPSFHIGYMPDGGRWTILTIGTIDLELNPDGTVRTVRFPGWAMQYEIEGPITLGLPTITTGAGYVTTVIDDPFTADLKIRPENFKIGGWTLPELQAIATTIPRGTP